MKKIMIVCMTMLLSNALYPSQTKEKWSNSFKSGSQSPVNVQKKHSPVIFVANRAVLDDALAVEHPSSPVDPNDFHSMARLYSEQPKVKDATLRKILEDRQETFFMPSDDESDEERPNTKVLRQLARDIRIQAATKKAAEDRSQTSEDSDDELQFHMDE